MRFFNTNTDHEQILKKEIHPLFVSFLIPNFVAMLAASLTFFVDAYVIGNGIGETGFAVVGLTAPISGILYALGAWLGFGGSTLFSVYSGAEEEKRAKGVFTSTFLCLIAAVLLIVILGLIFTQRIISFLGAEGELLKVSALYAKYILFFGPTYAIEQYIAPFLRNDNEQNVAMRGAIAGSIVNCFLDVFLVLVLKMDVTGIALSIGLSLITICAVDLSVLFKRGSSLRFSLHPDMLWDLWKSVCVGLPSLVSEASSSVVALVFNWMILRSAGESEVAVYGVIVNLSSIVVLLLMAPSNSMQPIVSSNFGAGKHNRSKQALKCSILYCLALSLFFALIGFFFTKQVTSIFIEDGNMRFIDLAIPAIRLAFLSYIFCGLTNQFTVYLQSMSANKVATTVSVLRGVILPVTCVILLGLLFGIRGVWTSMVVSEVLGTIFGSVAVRNIDPAALETAFEEDVEL